MHKNNTGLPHASEAAQTPRRRRAIAALATTVGVAAVVTTTFAPPAQAAHRYAAWDRVADCESSGHWHIDTGNGYYGGLQFSSSTWASYHGHKYAGEADGATRREQIEVARRVLAAQGRDAWPVCGPRAGLTHHSGHATDAALPAHPGSRVHKHHQTGHKARHHAHKRTHQRAKARRHAHHTYRVRPGDTLTAIARSLNVPGGWHGLYRANRHRLAGADVLDVGQLLHLP